MPMCLVTRRLEKWRRRATEMDSEFGQPVHDIGIYLMQQDKLDESIHNPGLPFSSSALTCHTPKAADRLGLALNVGDKGRVGVKWTLFLTAPTAFCFFALETSDPRIALSTRDIKSGEQIWS
jgi:hypothetical protein